MPEWFVGQFEDGYAPCCFIEGWWWKASFGIDGLPLILAHSDEPFSCWPLSPHGEDVKKDVVG